MVTKYIQNISNRKQKTRDKMHGKVYFLLNFSYELLANGMKDNTQPYVRSMIQ